MLNRKIISKIIMSSFEPFLTQQNSLSLLFSKVISFLSKLDNLTVIEELSNYRSMLFELKKRICFLEHHATIGKLTTSKKEILEKDTKKLFHLINKVSKKQLSNKKQFVIKYQTVIDYIHKIILKYISKEYLLLRKEIFKNLI